MACCFNPVAKVESTKQCVAPLSKSRVAGFPQADPSNIIVGDSDEFTLFNLAVMAAMCGLTDAFVTPLS